MGTCWTAYQLMALSQATRVHDKDAWRGFEVLYLWKVLAAHVEPVNADLGGMITHNFESECGDTWQPHLTPACHLPLIRIRMWMWMWMWMGMGMWMWKYMWMRLGIWIWIWMFWTKPSLIVACVKINFLGNILTGFHAKLREVPPFRLNPPGACTPHPWRQVSRYH